MFRKIMDVIVLGVIITGMAAISYPSFSTFVNQQFANNEIIEYQNQIENSEEVELQKYEALAAQYNSLLPITFPADPFTDENINDFEGTEFEDFFMVQEGSMLGYIEIPDIDIYLPVYYGTTDEVLAEGLGLLENTSLPVGGENTHAVISGHSGMASKKLFTDLNQLEMGDIFFTHVLSNDFAYQVDQIKVVLPTETDDLYIVDGEDYITLITCTPFGINDHRLLVRGKRIDYDFSTENIENTWTTEGFIDKYLWIIMLLIGIAAIIIWVTMKSRKKKTTYNKKYTGKE